MRRLVALVVAGIAIAVPVGRCTRTCPGDYPLIRQNQLLEKSEDVRQVDEKEWRRPWMTGPPNHLTPDKIKGGIL